MSPPGWPAGLATPADPDFEVGVTRWMLDIGPGEWRGEPLLTWYPVVLAFRLEHEIEGRLAGARQAYSAARRTLGGLLDPVELEAVLTALAAEGAELSARLREVALVARALEDRAGDSER